MKRNKGNKFKSGASLIIMLACMAVIASVFGYFVCSWFLDYISAPEEEIQSVNNNEVVQEEKINPEAEENNQNAVSQDQNSVEEEVNSSEAVRTEQASGQDLFVVQVGAFSKEENAKSMVEKLKNSGFTAYITSENPYRVQAGAFRTEKAAKELETKLKEHGFPVYIRD